MPLSKQYKKLLSKYLKNMTMPAIPRGDKTKGGDKIYQEQVKFNKDLQKNIEWLNRRKEELEKGNETNSEDYNQIMKGLRQLEEVSTNLKRMMSPAARVAQTKDDILKFSPTLGGTAKEVQQREKEFARIPGRQLAIARHTLENANIFVERLPNDRLEKEAKRISDQIEALSRESDTITKNWEKQLKDANLGNTKKKTIGQIATIVKEKMRELQEEAQTQANSFGETAGRENPVSHYLYQQQADAYQALEAISKTALKGESHSLFTMPYEPFGRGLGEKAAERSLREAELEVIKNELQTRMERAQKAQQRGEVSPKGAREFMRKEGAPVIARMAERQAEEKAAFIRSQTKAKVADMLQSIDMQKSIKLDQLFRNKVRFQYTKQPQKGMLHYQKGWDKVRNQHIDFLDGLKLKLGRDRTQTDSQKAMHYYSALNMLEKILEDEKNKSWLKGGRWDKSMGRLDEIVKTEKEELVKLYGTGKGKNKTMSTEYELPVSMNYIKEAQIPSGKSVIDQYQKILSAEKKMGPKKDRG